MSVKIIDFAKRVNSEGKEFFALILMGGIELIKSSKTGNYYANSFKTSITSTFSEAVCKSLVGQTLPGVVERVESEPYEYKIQETGETIMLTHKYRFNPNPNSPSMEETVFSPEMATAE